MSYFTTSETFFVVPLDVYDEEIQKIDVLLTVLEKSGAGEIIEKAYCKSSFKGRKSYNPYRLFVAIIYSFAMHKGTLRFYSFVQFVLFNSARSAYSVSFYGPLISLFILEQEHIQFSAIQQYLHADLQP